MCWNRFYLNGIVIISCLWGLFRKLFDIFRFILDGKCSDFSLGGTFNSFLLGGGLWSTGLQVLLFLHLHFCFLYLVSYYHQLFSFYIYCWDKQESWAFQSQYKAEEVPNILACAVLMCAVISNLPPQNLSLTRVVPVRKSPCHWLGKPWL